MVEGQIDLRQKGKRKLREGHEEMVEGHTELMEGKE
jgi:hypothetical protein